ALAVTVDVARPDNCAPYPPPPDFAVSIKPAVTGANYVDISWTIADPFAPDPPGVSFSDYVIQRRDDTAGGAFAPVITSTFRNAHQYSQLISDPTHVPPCVASQGCVDPGHTYTYRVIAQFRYSVGCPLNDGNLHDAIS